MMSAEERTEFDAENRRLVAEFNDVDKRRAKFAQLDETFRKLERDEPFRLEAPLTKAKGFWAEDDEDEFAQVEDGDEDVEDDEISSMAHAEMELHREMRQYARIAAWDMPMLSSKFNDCV